MNLLDRLIDWIAPRAGEKRMAARMSMKVMRRAYEGAKSGRRTDGWVTTGASANTEVGAAHARLRDRASDLVRNNPLAANAIRIWETNSIGAGIIGKANTGRKTADAQIDQVHQRWIEECDADGQNDLYGIQALAVRGAMERGDSFIRFRNRNSRDGMEVPLQLQVLEADYLDHGKNGPNGANLIIQGIEFNPIGQRVAYWMFTQHPGDSFTAASRLGFTSVRVPASEIAHLYRKERPGQIRGVSWFAPVVMPMHDLDDGNDAELMRRKIAACHVAFVTQDADGDQVPLGAPAGNGESPQTAELRVEAFEPGMISYGKPGEDIQFNTPPDSGDIEGFTRVQARSIAVGLGVTYEDLTGDLGNVNYSSYRAGHLRHQRNVRTFQRNCIIPMLCRPIRRRFIDTAFLAGVIPAAVKDGELIKTAYATKYTPPAFESVDPGKDAKATLTEIRIGTKTWPQAVAEKGYDPDDQAQEIADTNEMLDEKGIILDCDPRKMTQAGQAVAEPVTGDTNDASAAQD